MGHRVAGWCRNKKGADSLTEIGPPGESGTSTDLTISYQPQQQELRHAERGSLRPERQQH